jgi:predicted methyltransferase
MNKRLVALALIASTHLAAAETTVAPYIAAAVSDPSRPAKMVARDANRHPAELLAFSGIRPGDRVADLIPGGGYFSNLFSLVVGAKGHVYEVWPAEYVKVDGEEVAPGTKNGAPDPRLPNATILLQPAAAFAAPEKLDLVWTSQNYHDYPDPFMGPTDPAVLDRAVFAALKPGGVFFVIDHAAAAGSGTRDTNTLHRIDPAVVKAQVAAAGFVFEGESPVLRNPADDHTKLVFDKAIRGHTDQFVFKFRKPG